MVTAQEVPDRMSRWLPIALSLAAACASRRPVLDSNAASLSLLNRTSEDVCFIYLSPVDADSWGDDLLDSGAIPPGRSRRVNLPVGEWDLRTENCQREVTGTIRRARIAHGTNLLLQ